VDFRLSQEQQTVRDNFARFCDEQVKPEADKLDQAHEFPWEPFRQLGELGLFGMRYPEDVGGSDMELVPFCLALAEIARGSMSLAGCAAMQSLMGTKFLHMLGNEDIRERLFIPALKGDARKKSMAATGSTARRCGSRPPRLQIFSPCSPGAGKRIC
jgi:butyryl-CoA dehydrogenase